MIVQQIIHARISQPRVHAVVGEVTRIVPAGEITFGVDDKLNLIMEVDDGNS